MYLRKVVLTIVLLDKAIEGIRTLRGLSAEKQHAGWHVAARSGEGDYFAEPGGREYTPSSLLAGQ